MPTYGSGRHEHGQNFLVDTTIGERIVDLVSATTGPIVEIGPGRGALTFGLERLDRPLTAVEIDARHARWLRARVRPSTCVVDGDFLRWRLPASPHVIVGNLPFHQTTAILRKMLHAPNWTAAVVMVQWEVARRRAAVGGSSMMTAQWWPWVEFSVQARVPAAAFRPRPSVDAGLLVMCRRPEPLLDPRLRSRYRHFVHAVFTARGHGLPEVLSTVCDRRARAGVTRWLAAQNLRRSALPRDLSAAQWADLFRLAQS